MSRSDKKQPVKVWVRRRKSAQAEQPKSQVKKWHTPRHDDKLKELHAKGKTDSDIGTCMGFASGTISDNRRRLGLPCNYKPKPPVQRVRAGAEVVVNMPELPSACKVLDTHFGERINGRPGWIYVDGKRVSKAQAIMIMQKERRDGGKPPARFKPVGVE